jgi:hypothetical protein
MQRTNIYLDEDQLRTLKHLAAEERSNVATLVRRAVDDYLARRLAGDRAWGQRLDDLLNRVQTRSGSLAPNEIEAEITAARQEVRDARQARRTPSGH